ncbi:MAG TPA: hypothetical protein VNU71_06730 [Burkholderiaceae bacterium]|nr:hypothetical protein [Burkholderiaceae bacterium]
MRIGFASIYAWRPHVEHMHYLSLLAQRAGHEVRFLTCDSDLPTCYSRQLRPQNPAAWECLKCRLGSTRSFEARGVTSMGSTERPALRHDLDARFVEWARSSANTLWRFETPAELASTQALQTARELARAVSIAYAAAGRWIEREGLDGIYLFNGRMDVTRGVLEAARERHLPFVSVERTWFGDGVALLPGEDCLGLQAIDRMVQQYDGVPLLPAQAARIGRHVASRFLRVNTTEWRAYNQQATLAAWPGKGNGPRMLILPSSRNEYHGHPDWRTGWEEPTQALDAVLDHLGLEGRDCVLRCHPNWSERIGHATGERPQRYYAEWARSRGVSLIGSAEQVSTLGLIQQCDAVLVNGSSAGLEAGILGKQVIGTGPSWYQRAGHAASVYAPGDLAGLALNVSRDDATRRAAAEHAAQRALRFGFTMAGRVPQFVEHVRAGSSLDFDYATGADGSRLARMLETQQLEADDDTRGLGLDAENTVLQTIAERRWGDLLGPARGAPTGRRLEVSRRAAFRAIDPLRRTWATGDR